MKHQAPKLNVLIKLYKETQPIRPVVNYRCAPAYKIAKFMAERLKQNLDLPYTYNITNASQYAENIKLVAQPTYRMITLDITNLYTNISNTETLDIIQTGLQNSTQWDKELQIEVLDLLNDTTKQNYFKVNDAV
jgi:hypothetical protein